MIISTTDEIKTNENKTTITSSDIFLQKILISFRIEFMK